MGRRRCPLAFQGLRQPQIMPTLCPPVMHDQRWPHAKGGPRQAGPQASKTKPMSLQAWGRAAGRISYPVRLRPSFSFTCASTIQNLGSSHLKLLNFPKLVAFGLKEKWDISPSLALSYPWVVYRKRMHYYMLTLFENKFKRKFHPNSIFVLYPSTPKNV